MMESEADIPTLPPSDESERKPGPNYHRRKLILAGILVAIFVSLGILLAWDYSVCPLVTILPAGTSVSIPAGSHVAYSFNVTKVLNTNREIYGSLTSDSNVILYVTTAQQYSYWASTGPSGPYEFASGPVTSLSYHSCGKYQYCASLPPTAPLGLDYLVLRNPGQTPITVRIGMAMVLQIC